MSEPCPLCDGSGRVRFQVAPRYDVPTKFQSEIRTIIDNHKRARGLPLYPTPFACPVCGGDEPASASDDNNEVRLG